MAPPPRRRVLGSSRRAATHGSERAAGPALEGDIETRPRPEHALRSSMAREALVTLEPKCDAQRQHFIDVLESQLHCTISKGAKSKGSPHSLAPSGARTRVEHRAVATVVTVIDIAMYVSSSQSAHSAI
jgi:hypothetical protein